MRLIKSTVPQAWPSIVRFLPSIDIEKFRSTSTVKMLVQKLFLALLAVGSTNAWYAWKYPSILYPFPSGKQRSTDQQITVFHFAKIHSCKLGNCAATCSNGAYVFPPTLPTLLHPSVTNVGLFPPHFTGKKDAKNKTVRTIAV